MTRPDVRLRPLREDDLPLLGKMFAAAEETGEYAWYGFGTVAALRRRLAEDGGIDPRGGHVSIESAGDWVGYLSWYAVHYGGAAGSHAWRFGLALAPSERGRGVGTVAARLVADYLLHNTPVHRVEGFVDAEHETSRRMMERAGYTYEGRLRRAEFRAGCWRDLLVYARLREDG